MRYSVYDTTIQASDEDDKHARPLFRRLLGLLRRNGFHVGPDPRIVQMKLRTLMPTHRLGTHGDLQVAVECSGRMVRLMFFQELVRENRNGGRYDFSKLEKMPYVVRLRYSWIKRKIHALLIGSGYEFVPEKPRWVDDPLGAFNGGWDGEYEKSRGVHRFRRRADGWPDESELKCWRRTDRDGVVINHGETRYAMLHGRAHRCKVYGGINGMWVCITGKDRLDYHQISGCALRSEFPGRGRHFDDERKLRSLRRDFHAAIASRRFLVAQRMQDHCDRFGIILEVNTAAVA